MSSESQASYIRAVKCLGTKPSSLQTRFALRLYDDFQYVHATILRQIHLTAVFLPCESVLTMRASCKEGKQGKVVFIDR